MNLRRPVINAKSAHPAADTLGVVRELVQRWVIESNWRSGGVGATYKRCANELEAALAQAPASGEAVAPFGYCADFETGLYECSHKFYYLAPGQPVPEGCTPFYTTPPAPAPAVRVDDALLRVSDEDLRWCKDTVGALQEAGGPTNNMRAVGLSRLIAALEAALGQEKA